MFFSSWRVSASLVFASSIALSGCIVDLDAGGNGGTGGQGGSGAQGGQGGSGGQPGCDEHADCGEGNVCIYSTGECLPACFEDAQCGLGFECNECASSSCPMCDNCIGACVPSQTPGCDDHADCPGGLCIFSTGQCAGECTDEGQCVAGEECVPCATSSCPSCKDCLAACLPAQQGCDSHDDCTGGDLCVFSTGECAPECTFDLPCPDGKECSSCGTSSCPECDDCRSVCLTPEGFCDSHDDCTGGELCVFSTGQCEPACSGAESCPVPGEVCHGCGTASCPDCNDCLSVCVPGNGKCDTSDDCGAGETCWWLQGWCAQTCTTDADCAGIDAVCEECATSSCPLCEDCVDICVVVP